MELKHTPGPWDADGSHIYAPDGECIAMVCNPGRKPSDYPLTANRRLMVAAPDLLSALAECEAFFDERADVTYDGESPNEEMKMLSIVRAAIAKATGAAQ